MIAAPLSQGAVLGELTLNASNVVVESSDDDVGPPTVPPVEYVRVTVSGAADLGPDGVWHPGRPSTSPWLSRLNQRLVTAGARFAYVRGTQPSGTITIFLPRLRT